MKKSLILVAAALALTAAFTACSKKNTGAASGPRKIIIATGGNTAPSTFRNEKDELVGYETDVAKEVFSRLPQYTIEFTIADSHSTLTGLDAGLYQVSYNTWGYNKSRGEKYIISDVATVVPHAFVTRTENTDIKSVFDFPGHHVITLPGNANDITYRNWNARNPDKQIDVGYVENLAGWETKVANGEIDFYYHSKPVILATLAKTGVTGVKVTDVSVEDERTLTQGIVGNFFYFPKGEEQLRDDFNHAFKDAVADGSIAKIFAEYYPGYDFLITPEYIKSVRDFIANDLAK